jgi:hypothetical protein
VLKLGFKGGQEPVGLISHDSIEHAKLACGLRGEPGRVSCKDCLGFQGQERGAELAQDQVADLGLFLGLGPAHPEPCLIPPPLHRGTPDLELVGDLMHGLAGQQGSEDGGPGLVVMGDTAGHAVTTSAVGACDTS